MANENRYHSTEKYGKIHTQTAGVELDKERIENRHKTHVLAESNVHGSNLNVRTLELENSKIDLDAITETTSAMKAEYRSGAFDTKGNARLQQIQANMATKVITIAAQKQRQVAAQYIEQKAISTELSNNLSTYLDIAQGVGGETARVRARSSALAALNKIEAEALENNVKLLGEEAQSAGKTLKVYSETLVRRAIAGDTSIAESSLAAALQAQAGEKNIQLFEEARGARTMNQDLLGKIIVANAGSFKEAGGYHLQDDLELSVNTHGANYNNVLAKKRMGTLAGVSASDVGKLKASWVKNFANNISAGITNGNPADLRNAYTALKQALTNDDIRATLGDSEDDIRIIEAALADKFGADKSDDDRPQPINQP